MSRHHRIALLVLPLALACRPAPTATRADLRAYLVRAKTWAPVEAEAARTIERILGTQFVNEAEVLRQIADSRPRVVTHLQMVRAYAPHSKEVAGVHARYIAAWERLLRGYDAIEDGFSSGDYTKLARGREAMETWRATIVGVADELRELMQHFGVDATGAVESRARELPPREFHFSTHST